MLSNGVAFSQASHFGTCPFQLLGPRTPHPPRGPRPCHVPRPLDPLVMSCGDDAPLAFAVEASPSNVGLGSIGGGPGGSETADDDSLAVVSSLSLMTIAKEVLQQHQQAGRASPPAMSGSKLVPVASSAKPAPVVAMRASSTRCVGVDSTGGICAFSWTYDRVVERDDDFEEDESEEITEAAGAPPASRRSATTESSLRQARRASIRALGAGIFEQPVEASAQGANVLDAVSLGAFWGGCASASSPSALVSISSDGRFIAAPEASFARAVRLVELGSAKVGDACIAVRGESSVVASDAPVTLIKLFGASDDDEDVCLLVGAADGTASVWRVERAGKLFGRRHAVLSRRMECVLRGHGDAVVAGDADSALQIAATAAEDGAVLVHALRVGSADLVRRIAKPYTIAKRRRRPLSLGLSASRGLAVICFAEPPAAVLEVLSLNGRRIACSRLAYIPANVRVVGAKSDALLLVSHDRIELLALDAGLAPVKTIAADAFHDQRSSPPLLDADLGPDSAYPAAIFAATADATVALRVLSNADEYFDKRASNDASVSALVAAKASQVIGFAAAALGRGHDLKSSAEAFSTEALSWVNTTRKSIVQKINNNSKATSAVQPSVASHQRARPANQSTNSPLARIGHRTTSLA